MLLRLTIMIALSFSLLVNAEESIDPSKKRVVSSTTAVIPSKTESNVKSESQSESKSIKKQVTDSDKNLAVIDIKGVDSELKKNIDLHMPVSIPTCTADRGEVKQFFTTIKKSLRKASRALGYYDSEFRSGGAIVNNCWKLRLKIIPNLPTKVISQKIKVIGEGRDNDLFKNILKELPYEKGDVFNHQKYTDFKTLLSEATQALGYFDAEFEQHNIAVNPLTHQATVSLVLNTGKRYRYGKVTSDQEVLSDSTIKNFVILKTGNVYKTEDLIKQQQILQRSGYYKLIKVEVLHDQASNNQVPIHITLTRKKRNAFKYKVGYGSNTGARISAEMDRRWTGNSGQKFTAKAQVAQNLSGLSLQLTDPRENPEDDILVYNIDFQQDENNFVSSQSIKIGGKYTRKLPSDWVQFGSIVLLLDKTKKLQEKTESISNHLLFGVGLEKVKSDNSIYPKNGWRLKLGVKAAQKGLISNQSIFQIDALAKGITKVGSGLLLGKLRLGTTRVEDLDELPKSLMFFAGGTSSVRGYRFESLGAVNDENKLIGGKHLLELSLEYQHPITDEWSAAAFVDAGNAFNDDFSDAALKVGIGIGARWHSPIGPVRIDVGFPKDNFQKPVLHLSIGSDL